MYQDIRKERLHRMQSVPGQSSKNNLSTIVLIAILLFALSGLISGFAVGAFVRPNLSRLTNPNAGTTQSPDQTGSAATTTVKPTTHPIPLGYPVIDHVSGTEVADGTTLYTFSAHAVDQSIDVGHGNPVHAPDITCKLWLVQSIPDNTAFVLVTKDLQNVNTLQNPLTGEVQGHPYAEIQGLTFDTSTPQTRFCNAKGRTTWKYTISSSVPPGAYDLVVLTDWSGKHYNWSWANIAITKKAD